MLQLCVCRDIERLGSLESTQVRKTSREAADPRVIRRHQTGRPNAMASEASDEAFLLMECIKKYAVQGRT